MCNQPLSEHLADIDQIKGDSTLLLQYETARHYKNGFSGTNIIMHVDLKSKLVKMLRPLVFSQILNLKTGLSFFGIKIRV